MDKYSLGISILIILVSAIFAGLEVAFLASDKLMIEIQKNKNIFTNKVLTFILERPSYVLGTTLICTTIGMVLSSFYLTDIFSVIFKSLLPSYLQSDFFLLMLNTITITVITLLFAEFIPKSIFILSPTKFLQVFSIPLVIAMLVLYPIVAIMTFISKFCLKYVFKQNYIEHKTKFELKDFNSFIQKTLDNQKKSPTTMRAKMARNVINFRKVRMRDCMIPRTEIIAVNINEGIDSLKGAFIESEHSKVLVYDSGIDDIKGYCHLKDLLKKPKNIESILLPIIIIPETSFANAVMLKFIEEKRAVALVVDEYGGTAGIVTLEDIIEEIFGEIHDEHDTEELIDKKISNNTYIVSARTEIDCLNEKYHWNIPKGEYETLGGYITRFLGRIPQKNENVSIGKFRFIILHRKKTYIEVVKIILDDNID